MNFYAAFSDSGLIALRNNNVTPIMPVYEPAYSLTLALNNMPFPESLRVAVRKRAHLRCCICRSVGVEIHHITPEEEAGPDTEDNAAPLCPSCHEIYGANPTKRKFIREARDFWYELCARQQSHNGLTADDLSRALQPVATKSDIAEVKAQITKLLAPQTQTLSTSAIDEFRPVPIERFIKSLFEEEFEDSTDLYDLLFDSRAWYEPEEDSYDLLDHRALFLKLYGEETARRVCLTACKSTGLNPNGFSEHDLAKALHLVHVIVILVTEHEKFADQGKGLQCAIGPDGEFKWQVVTSAQRKPNRGGKSTRNRK